jgi:hypothetical protein
VVSDSGPKPKSKPAKKEIKQTNKKRRGCASNRGVAARKQRDI